MDRIEGCIFCKIASGERSCHKVWEDKSHLAFLDIKPNTKGMTLVISKKHYESYAVEMPDKAYAGLLLAARKVAKLLDKKLGTKRTAFVLEGMGVNHVHVKLYPLHGLDKKFAEIFSPETKFFERYMGYLTTELGPRADDKELAKLAREIRESS